MFVKLRPHIERTAITPKSHLRPFGRSFVFSPGLAKSFLIRFADEGSPKLGQPYQGFRIAAIGGSRLLYLSNGNAVTYSGNGGHLLDCSLATGGTTPPKRQRGGRRKAVALCSWMLHWWHSFGSPIVSLVVGGNMLRPAVLSRRPWFDIRWWAILRLAIGMPRQSADGQGGRTNFLAGWGCVHSLSQREHAIVG